MASRIHETNLSKVDTIKTTIQQEFQYLHVTLDERESEILYELDEIRSNIISKMKQWEKSIEDVNHTISHAKKEIRDNSWGFKLIKEAREELKLLEISKPIFDVECAFDYSINESISKYGELTMKQIKKIEREMQFDTFDTKNSFGIDKTDPEEIYGEFLCSISPEIYREKSEAKNLLEIVGRAPVFPGQTEIPPKQPDEKIYNLSRSISCIELNAAVSKPEIGIKYFKALDDSFITTKPKNMKTFTLSNKHQETPVLEYRKEKRIKRSLRASTKGLFSRSFPKKQRLNTLQGASYKLSELKVHKQLTKRVTVTSRWDKSKEVSGILRCVVTGGKIPIVGIELDTPDGTSNGYHNGIQYFKTGKFKAYFLYADLVRIVI
ncbi:hypothetical protein LOD99_9259 [Oopsacas minuta]|uniref:CAP-Gly domain-containing protein n=1 Tax=Oopsacas minuta TaxID=111878 RepID=A0AAV7JC07_9METZ|nr:hypothetical protein LOD99_9259 [Oopsacas minuta]